MLGYIETAEAQGWKPKNHLEDECNMWRGNGGLDKVFISAGGENWLKTTRILKVKVTKFYNGLNVGYKKNRGVGGDFQDFA